MCLKLQLELSFLFSGHSGVYHEMPCGWHACAQLAVVHWAFVCGRGLGDIFATSL